MYLYNQSSAYIHKRHQNSFFEGWVGGERGGVRRLRPPHLLMQYHRKATSPNPHTTARSASSHLLGPTLTQPLQPSPPPPPPPQPTFPPPPHKHTLSNPLRKKKHTHRHRHKKERVCAALQRRHHHTHDQLPLCPRPHMILTPVRHRRRRPSLFAAPFNTQKRGQTRKEKGGKGARVGVYVCMYVGGGGTRCGPNSCVEAGAEGRWSVGAPDAFARFWGMCGWVGGWWWCLFTRCDYWPCVTDGACSLARSLPSPTVR
jgi:hypothetical protein